MLIKPTTFFDVLVAVVVADVVAKAPHSLALKDGHLLMIDT